jgi:hypothetical protein
LTRHSTFATSESTPQPPKTRRARKIIGGLVLLSLVAAGLLWYWLDWKSRRAFTLDDCQREANRLAEEFWNHLQTGRFEQAYELTGPAYRHRVRLESFKEQLGNVTVLPRHPMVLHTESGAGVTQRRFYESITLRDLELRRTFHLSIRMWREDSLLELRPPPIRVYDFAVRELP